MKNKINKCKLPGVYQIGVTGVTSVTINIKIGTEL